MWLYYSDPKKEFLARRVMRFSRWLRDNGMKGLAVIIWRQVRGVCHFCGQNAGLVNLILSKRKRTCFECNHKELQRQ